MSSHNPKGAFRLGASDLSCSSVVLLIFTSLMLSLPSSVLPLTAGHVEPLPGNSVLRRGSPMTTGGSSIGITGSSGGSSRAAILQKLTSPRRGPIPLPYDSTAPAPTGFYSQSQSIESHERGGSGGGVSPFTSFPNIPSPFSSISSTIPSSEKQHLHQRLHHYQRIQRQGINKPTAFSNLPPREEPSSSGDALRGSYFTTGDNATMSSVDLQTDPYKKQTVNSVETSSHPPSSPIFSSVPALATNNINNRSGKSLKNINSKNKTISPSLSSYLPIPPTLLPPSYLSLAAFRHLDGTLEKSSSNILSRIANFYRNLSKDVAVANAKGSPADFHNSISEPSSKHKSPIGKTDTYTMLLSDDDYDAEKISLSDHNDNNNRSDHPRHAGRTGSVKSESGNGSAMQTDKYIPMDDINSSEGALLAAQHQYLSLDDEREENNLIGGNNKKQDDAHVDDQQKAHHSQQQHATNNLSSESSVGYDFDMSMGDNDDSHSFHEDLFHPTTTTTTGTITPVLQKDQFPKDIIGSGSSLREQYIEKSEESARSSANFGISGLGISGPSGGSSSVVKNLGDVKATVWSLDSQFVRDDLIEEGHIEEDPFFYGMTIGGILKRELWTIPLFLLAALNMILIILFEVYVLCRARGQSRRHLFLGQMLLFGLFLCSFLALMFAVHPSIIGCFVGRIGVGITYSLIFSVLVVKCVLLLGLDTGVCLPTSYQAMLLFFAVLVQVAVDTQWVIMYPPYLQTVESSRSVLLQCGTSFLQILYSLSYVGFLILMVGFLAGRAAYRGVVENYKESVYILITAVVTVPVALSWTVAGWMLQGRHQDACISFGLVAHSLTIFLIMFMPKGRQLASLDKEAMCIEEQEDQCSGYSPSFYPYKPTTKNRKATLWGDGNLYTTLEPTVSTINPNVFFHRNEFPKGMIY